MTLFRLLVAICSLANLTDTLYAQEFLKAHKARHTRQNSCGSVTPGLLVFEFGRTTSKRRKMARSLNCRSGQPLKALQNCFESRLEIQKNQ